MKLLLVVMTSDFVSVKNQATGREITKEWTELPLSILYFFQNMFYITPHHSCLARYLFISGNSPIFLWFISERP